MYELTVEARRGHNLDLSLFERLVDAGVPHITLSTQRRMRPCISRCTTHPAALCLFPSPLGHDRHHRRQLTLHPTPLVRRERRCGGGRPPPPRADTENREPGRVAALALFHNPRLSSSDHSSAETGRALGAAAPDW